MPRVSHRFRYSEQHSSDRQKLASGASNTRRKSHTRDKHPSNGDVKQMSKRTVFEDIRDCKEPLRRIERPASAGRFKCWYRPGEFHLEVTGPYADYLTQALLSGNLCSTR